MKRHVLRFEQASFLVVVMLTAFLMISCIPRNPNTPPVADFKLVESSATELRQLHFDASTSTDKEDSTDKLIARWDFNGDGVWEIDYSANKKANEVVSHSYNVAGTTTVVVEVKDSKGLTSRKEKEIQINLAPPESLYLGSASGQEITIIWDDISTSEDSYNVSLNDNPLEQLPANTEEYTFELDTSATQTISVYCTKGTMKSN
ncbi:PKD domain-containing protein, partial [Mesotoga prima]|uniref:PKD domain-containing protein n=1 Tax=Mesotoga prima TaxID=1184387 RepID=UPI002FD9E09A